MEGLFDRLADFDQDVYRNIVSLRTSQDLFDDLSGGDESLSQWAAEAEMRVKQNLPAGIVQRGFHYTTAIGYPFEVEPFLYSRYGDGSFGVWYGSLTLETTLYETVHHMFQAELGVEGITEKIIRERAVYLVHCRALLVDLRGKEKKFPALVEENYEFTQQLGKRLSREGQPGLLAPSARCQGTNAVIFNPEVLGQPRNHCYLTYVLDPVTRTTVVQREPGKDMLTIAYQGKR